MCFDWGGVGGRCLCLATCLSLALVDGNNLTDQALEISGVSDKGEVVFDFRGQARIESRALRLIVPIQGVDERLKFGGVSGGGRGLGKIVDFIFAKIAVVAVEVDVVERAFKCRVVFTMGILWIYGDVTCPIERVASEARDDKEDLFSCPE